ncbi:MAG TPA: hypothetical protein VHM91_25335, partial [Verrucomicrobiales bacterium]|nr:hypothetical protein [Verrucomicrobiales bacterium]
MLRIISLEKLDYAQRDLWKKALPVLARTDPQQALALYRSRDFPDEDAIRMEESLVNAMMAKAPDLAEKEVPRLRHSVPAFAAFLAGRDANKAIAYAVKHPEAASSLEAALVFPDPAAAMKKWSPVSANKVEQGLWWAAARIRAGWLIKDNPPSTSGVRVLTAGARAVIQDIFGG